MHGRAIDTRAGALMTVINFLDYTEDKIQEGTVKEKDRERERELSAAC